MKLIALVSFAHLMMGRDSLVASTNQLFSSVENIFFDLDDTLFPFTKYSEEARRVALDNMIRHGLPINTADHDRILAILEESASEYTWRERDLFFYFLNRCELELDTPLSQVKKALLAAAGFLQYDEEMNSKLHSDPYAVKALKDLKNRGYQLGLITNGNGMYQAYKIVRLRLIPDLIPSDRIFISDEIGARKPNITIFKLVCSILHIAPETCCYVGDSFERDIIPYRLLLRCWGYPRG